MENVLLIIHLFLAMGLIIAVLLQKSEGGGLGMGGGGAGGTSGRAPATAMGKLTWLLGIAFIITSVSLTIIVARNTAGASVVDRLTDAPVTAPVSTGDTPSGESLLPPSADDNAPLVPAGD